MSTSSRSQTISDADIRAVTETLRSDYLTTGPQVAAFERAFADFTGMPEAVAVCNGTAALHAAMYAVGIQPGDEVIVPAMTFAATANCVVYQGGTPVFADVDVESLLLDPDQVERLITPRCKAIIAVDYAGQPCDYDSLNQIAQNHGLALVADACHAVGGSYKGKPVGSLAHLSTFSFHPVKNMTTGEGGMVTSDSRELARKMRLFRNHGIDTDHHQREARNSWTYELIDLGYNYRMTDFQCALGLAQLRRLPAWLERRREIARAYDTAFEENDLVTPVASRTDVAHAYHLYVVQLNLARLQVERAAVFMQLREKGIRVNVHYLPVHLHPFYQQRFRTRPGLCPRAEAAYERILSLPIHPNMSIQDANEIATTLLQILNSFLP